MTFLLEVDEDNAKVKLRDRSTSGKGLITKEEIEGIEVKLQQQKPAGTGTEDGLRAFLFTCTCWPLN